MVERDPELLARVEAFRAVVVDEPIVAPAGLLDRQVAAALAEFETLTPAGAGPSGADDALDGVGQESAAPVFDLRAESIRRSGQRTERANGDRSRPSTRPKRTMPNWLPAAAGFVIVGGGLIWAVGQAGGGDDDTEASETAVAAFDSDAGTDATAEAETTEESEVGEAEMATDDAMEEDAGDAMEESADEASRSDAAGAAPAEGESAESTEDSDDAEADFAAPEPLLFFEDTPDPDTIDDLPEVEPDLELSLCGAEIVAASLGDPVGFVPVQIGDQPAELFLFRDGDGSEIRVLVDDNCQPL